MADEPTETPPTEETITVADVTQDDAPAAIPGETESKAELAETDPPAQENDETGEKEETGLRDEKGRFKKGGVQDRIDDLTRKFRDAERRASYYEGLATQPAQNSAGDAAKPTSDQFDSYDDYIEALTDWKVAAKSQSLAQDAAKGVMEHERQANYAERLTEAKASIPDFDAVVGNSEIPIAPHVADAVLDSERGPEIFYQMAQRPELAAHLNSLSPTRAAMEIGRLEAQLATQPVKTPSNAPAPISPLTTGSTTKVNLAKADMETYIAERKKQGANFR
jgi:hypothetical protein